MNGKYRKFQLNQSIDSLLHPLRCDDERADGKEEQIQIRINVQYFSIIFYEMGYLK